MNNLLDQEFVDFKATNFAKGKDEWEPWFNYLMKDFYLDFLKNIEIIDNLLAPYINRSSTEFSNKEKWKINNISNLIAIFKSIKYDIGTKNIKIDEKIIKSFSQVKSENEINSLIETQKELVEIVKKNQGEEKAEELHKLILKSKVVVSFFHNEETRKSFFKDVIVNGVESDSFFKDHKVVTINEDYRVTQNL